MEVVFAKSQHLSLRQLRGELGPINSRFFLETENGENSWIGGCGRGMTAMALSRKNPHGNHQQNNSSQDLTNRYWEPLPVLSPIICRV